MGKSILCMGKVKIRGRTNNHQYAPIRKKSKNFISCEFKKLDLLDIFLGVKYRMRLIAF